MQVFALLFLSIVLIIWYRLAYLPYKKAQRLLAQGAQPINFKHNPNDDFDGIKKAIQKNPDMKAVFKKLPGKIVINFIDPDLIKEVLTNHHYYEKLNKTSELIQILAARGVISAEGASWKLHRVLLSEAFQYTFFNDIIPTIIQTTDQYIGITCRKEREVMLPDTTELIASDVATKTFFGMESANIMASGKRAPDELSYITMKMMSYSMSPLRFFPGMWALNLFSDYRDLKKRMRTFRHIFNELMVRRMQDIEGQAARKDTKKPKRDTDILEILLQYRHKFDNDPTKTLSNHEILDDFFIFCIAGKDTTSSLVSMALYCCERYPEWGAQVKEEVERIITTPEAINLDVLNSLSFMSAFLNEVLRVFPPVPMLLPRLANRDHFVGNIFVEKGTILTSSLVASNYNPKYFEDPEKFNPMRWLKSEKGKEGWKDSPFSYIPFSGGPRNCIGKHFALIEARVILSLVLKNYHIILEPEFQLKMGHIGVANLPKESIPFKFIPK